MRLFTYHRAGAVVVDGDNVLLASLQSPGQRRWWMFPGGGIEEGETARDAAIRELFEETGLQAAAARELVRAGVQGGQHRYFLVTCDDLRVGAVTGPELEEAASGDFRAEWVPISSLPKMPVFPRCVAEHIAMVGIEPGADGDLPWLEDDREPWEGVEGETPPSHFSRNVRAVIHVDGRVAAIERVRGDEQWFTLPGGGILDGEPAHDAVVREVSEELGLEVRPVGRVAVVAFRREKTMSMQTYFTCEATGGAFGTGTGDEWSEARQVERGTYRAVWLDPANLPPGLKPAWLADRLPQWLADPAPSHPDRFCEFHD